MLLSRHHIKDRFITPIDHHLTCAMSNNDDDITHSIKNDSICQNMVALSEAINLETRIGAFNDLVLKPENMNTTEETTSTISFQIGNYCADSNGALIKCAVMTHEVESRGASDVIRVTPATEVTNVYSSTDGTQSTSICNIPSDKKVPNECANDIMPETEEMKIVTAEEITNEKPLQVSKKKKVSDIVRVQKVLEDLSTKSLLPEQVLGVKYKRQKMGSEARTLLLEYAKEISSAILEESCILAKHRKSKEMNISDVKLIFGNDYWFLLDFCTNACTQLILISFDSSHNSLSPPSSLFPLSCVLGKKFGIDISGYQLRSNRLSASAVLAKEEEEEEEEEAVKVDVATTTASTEVPVIKIDETSKPVEEVASVVKVDKKEEENLNEEEEGVETEAQPADTEISGEEQCNVLFVGSKVPRL